MNIKNKKSGFVGIVLVFIAALVLVVGGVYVTKNNTKKVRLYQIKKRPKSMMNFMN
jgi:hypothetical protein